MALSLKRTALAAMLVIATALPLVQGNLAVRARILCSEDRFSPTLPRPWGLYLRIAAHGWWRVGCSSDARTRDVLACIVALANPISI